MLFLFIILSRLFQLNDEVRLYPLPCFCISPHTYQCVDLYGSHISLLNLGTLSCDLLLCPLRVSLVDMNVRVFVNCILIINSLYLLSLYRHLVLPVLEMHCTYLTIVHALTLLCKKCQLLYFLVIYVLPLKTLNYTIFNHGFI